MSDLFEDLPALTMAQLCRACGADAETIIKFIDAGLITPSGRNLQDWRFDRISLVRIRKAERLRRDLGVNIAGAALALELLDELETLRQKLRAAEAALGLTDRE